MKTHRLIKSLLLTAVLLLGGGAAEAQVLVAGTDFDGLAANKTWGAISDITYTGMITPTITMYANTPADVDYEYSTDKANKGAAISSHFQSGAYYAVTANPIRLDSIGYMDFKENDNGIVFSPQGLTANKTLMTFKVGGMVPGAAVKVVIKYRSVVDETKIAKCGNGSARCQFKVAVNEDSYNQTQGNDVTQIAMGASSTFTMTSKKADASGYVAININGVSSYSGDCSPFEITSIEVYSDINPQIYSVDGSPICAGELATLKSLSIYKGATYQWYKDGAAVSGATNATYAFESDKTASAHKYLLKVTYGGQTYTSNELDFATEVCCEITDPNDPTKTVPASRKVVFKEDFGEFDLSDATGHTYKVWDYSDIANPKQITKTTTTPFRFPIDPAPLGCTFMGTSGPLVDGYYCVAGVLTGYNAYQGYAGAHLEWANRIGGKTTPADVEYDHSGKLEGCALFINCLPNTGGKEIYEREIDNLCQNRQLFFECYYTVFTNSASGAYNPVDITLKMTEVGNASNTVSEVGTATIESDKGTGTWKKLQGQIFLEKKDAVLLEIINNSNVSENGNDLVIDDIIIKACAAPSIQAYYDLNTLDADTVSCKGDEPILVYAKPSDMLTTYFGGVTSTYYQYQYSTTPSDKKSWKNVGGLTQELKKDVSSVFGPLNLQTGDTLYFRVIAGSKYTMQNTTEDAFNSDDPCASYTISLAIPCVINCPTCTPPDAIKISSTEPIATGVVTLCAGESTTLTTNNVVPAQSTWASSAFAGYTLDWYLDGKLQSTLSKTGDKTTSEAAPNIVKNPGVTKDETHTWTVVAYDNLYPTASKCIDSAKIKVTFLAKPVVKSDSIKYCFGLPTATSALPTSTDGTINLLDNSKKALAAAPDLKTMPAGRNVYYYNLTSAAGCQSDTVLFVVNVDTIPTLKVPDVSPFCAGATTRVLPSDTLSKAYTIDWGGKEQNLSKLTGSATPYTYIYKVTDVKSSCVSVPEILSITAKPATKVSVKAVQTCGKTTVTTTLDPTTAATAWTLGGAALATTPTEFTELSTPNSGLLQVVATETGYCADTDTVTISVQAVPKKPTTADVSYLKSQASSFKDVMLTSGDKAAVMNDASTADLEFEWSSDDGVTWSTTAPTPTVKDAASPKEEDVTYRVRVTNKTTGCHSDTATVVARVYGAPVPNVSDTAYCVGTTAGALSSNVHINQALAGETYTLKYYDTDKTTELPASEIPSTTAAGVHTYYATQSSATGGESDKVGFKVTVYGVDTALVAKESYLYCKNDVATALTATVNKAEASYKMSDGLQWSSDGITWSATAPTPSTATVSSATYNVKQTYTITASKEVCEGKAVNITVTTSETTDPTGTMSVSYVLADADGNGGKFKDLLGQSATTVDVEAGYTYQYAECDASGAVSGAWSTTVPTPSVPSKSDLNGGSTTIYYAVKRIATAAPNCESGTKVITVTISDSPMPDVTPGYYCEGETIADLGSSVKVNTQKKTADKYELLWYGTTKPASSADYAAGSATAPATPAATVADSKTPNVMTYYVAQKDKETDAIGTASALVITVYPKPVQTITDPAAVCETAVDLGKSLKYDAVVKTATYNTSYYSDAAGTTALTGSTVTESGAYYVQTAFAVPSATNSGAVCASTVDKITVTVDTLTLQKVIDAQTCPNTAAILTATAGSNAKSVVFDWSGESNSDTKSDAQTPASGSAISKFTTAALAGKAGDTYKYDLKVTAGTCTESQKGIVITIGDGPVEGTLKLEETDNKETGKVYTDTRDNTADPFYTCGNGITATASFTKDATPDYTWSDANGKSVGTGATAKLPGAGIYTITYNNQCATSVKFEVKDASIKDNKLTVTSKVTPSATGKELELCEGEAFSMDLSYTCAEAGTISWTRDGTAATGISGKSVSLPKATPAESGTYAYTITNHGCTATGDTTIKVKPYIQFAPEQYAYVARRDSQLTIKTNITVPATGTPSDISWTENGTSAGTGKDKDLTVTSDHSYLVKMSDADYCPTETTVTVTMDARLKLSAKVDAKMCRGDKGVYLTIDTTGTGKFVYPSKAKITVTETIGSASHTLSGWSKAGDTLKLEVSPSADATYKVDFTYREGEGVDAQSTSASASITVLQPIYITVPTGLSVCSDSALDITLEKLGPTGTTVAWDADATITSGTTGESVTVSPVYESASGLNHNSTKWYYLTASYEGCHDKRDSVKVTVNEPITGTMPTDTTICEGTSVRLDAGSYGATTYEWTTASQASAIGSSQSLSVTPKATTTYTVSMARGKCKATADETVNVNSNPVITSVDSLSYRKVAIMVDASYGTSPYYYSVDKGVSDLSNEKDSLTYSNHTAYVVDAVGCKASYPFSITAPKIKIPDYFSPNGDGTNDGWKIPGIDQTYPNAEITIFDRWGKKIASYKGADEGWDGKYNGHDMPTTDYWYEIQVREIDKTYTGHFTLLRR